MSLFRKIAGLFHRGPVAAPAAAITAAAQGAVRDFAVSVEDDVAPIFDALGAGLQAVVDAYLAATLKGGSAVAIPVANAAVEFANHRVQVLVDGLVDDAKTFGLKPSTAPAV